MAHSPFDQHLQRAQQQLQTVLQQLGDRRTQDPVLDKALTELSHTLAQLTAGRTNQPDPGVAHLQDILNFAHSVIYVKDLQGRYTLVNQAFLDLFGCTRSAIIGKTNHEFFPPDIADQIQANDDLLLSTGTSQQFEETVRTGGTDRIFLSNKFVLRDELGNVYAICGISTEISDRKQIEAMLNQYLSVIEAAADGIAILQGDTYLYLNRAHLEMFGYTRPEELVGQSWQMLYSPEELARIEREVFPVLVRDRVWAGEAIAQRQDGTLFDEGLSLTLTDNGLLICVCRDVSDRKRADRALRDSQQLLKNILDTVPIAVFWKDPQLTYQGINASAAKILGVNTVVELIGQTDAQLPWQPQAIEAIQAEDRQILASGIAQLNKVSKYNLTDGTAVWLETNKIPLRDIAGQIIGVLGTAQDITERKQAEMQLQDLSDRLALALKVGAVGIWDWDLADQVTWDPQMKAIYGLPPRDCPITYQDWRDRVHEADIDRVEAQLQATLRGSGRYDTEYRIWRTDGELRWIHVIAQLQHDVQGKPLRLIGINRDITHRKQIEELLRRQAEHETLLREITQRIRQSLDLPTIFATACEEVRQTLQVDRVAIFQFYPEAGFNDGEFVAESLVGGYTSVVKVRVHDHCFGNNFATLYAQGRYHAVADIQAGGLEPCHNDILTQFQVRANLVVPLVQGDRQLWGLLCVHQCRGVRPWQSAEIELTQQIANQLAIAIQQADLYNRIQADLQVRQEAEAQIARQLQQQQALATITESIRESLSVEDILATVTQQVKAVMQCDRVIIFRLFPDGRSRIVEEAVAPEFANLKDQHWEDEKWSQEILETYWQGQPRIVPDVMDDIWTDCLVDYSREGHIQSKIVAPILQEAHGSAPHRWVAPWANDQLWGILVVHACQEKRVWQEAEAQLLQQIANQVVIAIHQANLFEQLQQELTERQQTQQQLTERNQQLAISNQALARATRLKDEFLANMSHELRTPLNAILGMTEGLQEAIFGAVSERQIQALQTIERSGIHLLSLINDILDVAKIEAGQLTLDYAPVAVSQLCESSLTFVRQQALKKNLQLTTQMPAHLPELYVDELRIRQVLINLLTNAVKFTPEGGQVTVTVSVAASPEVCPAEAGSAPSGTIRFAVTDTGIGVSSENIPKLFQPFIQVDSALNRQYEGTGLGLALVKRLVELHGGAVGLTSEVGVGSCFFFTLPFTPAPAATAEPTQPISADLILPPSAQSPLILLAEDNEANTLTISTYLKAKGYRLIVAANGPTAITLAQTERPDLILMDVQMPGMDGLEAIRQLRGNPDLAAVPIIALTALAMADDRDRCLAAGADEYFSKPVKLKDLTQTIQQLSRSPSR